jgi:hypothetical protein
VVVTHLFCGLITAYCSLVLFCVLNVAVQIYVVGDDTFEKFETNATSLLHTAKPCESLTIQNTILQHISLFLHVHPDPIDRFDLAAPVL